MAESIVSSILRWLRAGYPEGVPPKDYYPLLALLRNTLSNEEFEEVVAHLEEQDSERIRIRDIRAAIEHVTDEPPNEEDMRSVAARLAAVGWPLSGGARRLAEEHAALDPQPEESPGPVQRVLAWLRKGYPDGVPTSDYVPLLALLGKGLTEDQVREVADALIAQDAEHDGVVSRTDVQVLMMKVLGDLPSDDDLARVRARLADVGWEIV